MIRTKRLRHLLLLFSLCFYPLHSATPERDTLTEHAQPESSIIPEEIGPGYTINFNNVSILEYIKFVSRVAKLNFIYNEDELKFNVTVMSEEATSLVNVMSALVQVLKINGYSLVEQGNNLIITKGSGMRQIATVVSQENPLNENEPIPPIMTRVFKIKNANPIRLGDILTPLLSPDAILEASAESRHIIITDITQNIEQVQKLLLTLDAPKSSLEIDSYSVRNNPPEALITLATQLITPLSEGNPVILVPQKETSTIFIVSTPFLIEQAIMILEDLDNPPSLSRKHAGPITAKNILLYHIENKPTDVLENAIRTLEGNLEQLGPSSQDLVETLKSMRYIRDSHSLLFIGNPDALDEIKGFLTQLDVPYSTSELEHVQGGFFIYKITAGTEDQISRSLEKLVLNLKKAPYPDTDLIQAIDSMKWIKENNSLIFTGDQRSLDKLKQILPSFDTPPGEGKTASKLPLSNDFYVYSPKHQDGEELLSQVHDVAKSLQSSGLADPAFLHALNTAKWVSSSQSIVFTGDPQSLDRIHALLAVMDQSSGPKEAASTLFVYKIEYVNPDHIETALRKLAKSVPTGSSLATSIDNMKYIKESNSLVFRGPPETIAKIKEFIVSIDDKEGAKVEASDIFVYTPERTTPDEFKEHILEAAKNMKKSGLSNPQLIDAIESARLVSNDTAVMFTGTEHAIEELKKMIAKFDLGGTEKSTDFFVYKPLHITSEVMIEHAKAVAENMESSGLSNPALIKTLRNARLVSGGKGVLFTGPPSTIIQVKELMPSLDEVKLGDGKKVGKSTFYIYKIQNVNGQTLVRHLRNMADDLKRTGTTNDPLIKTLNNMRYVRETNSIIFTGTPDVLERAKALAEKFDIPALASDIPARSPSGYLIYQPKYVSGTQLIATLSDFEQNLSNSGVQDKGLIDVIHNLKWMERTNSILISGSDQDTKKVYELLERFDIPGVGGDQDQSGIESISDMSFLVYKVQYHNGVEIQSAIRKIGDDIAKLEKGTKTDAGLLSAINALQWIEVTNSLISTGHSSSLAKLRELIKSIDVPLKQVFVEILVLETTVTNSLNFGLRWGSQGQYRDKFSYSTSATPQDPISGDDTLATFGTALKDLSATTTPTGKVIPMSTGFDLGVLGDIILHKGKSYFAIGSLLNAIRGDADSTIVLNQKMITQDNKNATIFVGENIPYTGSIVTNTTSNNGQLQNSNLEYRDIGVSLSITPQIGNNDTVTLNINEEITEQIGDDTSTNTSTTNLNGIKTSKTSTQTSVTVPDKSFLVLSGQIRNTTSHVRTSIPCLGGLPLIGAAFQQNDTLKANDSVLIFVRPHIIKSFDVYKEVTAHQEDVHRAQTNNDEEFDAGLELVKTPDDE